MADTPIQRADFAPEHDYILTQNHFWATVWPVLASALTDLHDDLKMIAAQLQEIANTQKAMHEQNQAAAEINKVTLTQIRAQMQGGIIQAGLAPNFKKR